MFKLMLSMSRWWFIRISYYTIVTSLFNSFSLLAHNELQSVILFRWIFERKNLNKNVQISLFCLQFIRTEARIICIRSSLMKSCDFYPVFLNRRRIQYTFLSMFVQSFSAIPNKFFPSFFFWLLSIAVYILHSGISFHISHLWQQLPLLNPLGNNLFVTLHSGSIYNKILIFTAINFYLILFSTCSNFIKINPEINMFL